MSAVTSDTLPFPSQPKPVGLLVSHIPEHAPERTAIVREWREGEGRLCKFCPPGLCCLTPRGTCLVIAPGFIAPRDAAVYRVPG